MRSVNLTKRVKTTNGLRFCPVVMAANGRVKPDRVLIDGKEATHPEGAYYIDWKESGRRCRLSVGRDAASALAKRLRKQAELNAEHHGVELVKAESKGQMLAEAVTRFMDQTRATKKKKTQIAYGNALRYFSESCSKKYVSDVDRADLLRFSAFLRDEKRQAPRSVYNKFEIVVSFLKAQGIHGLVTANDWPRYVETEPQIYERSDIERLLAACSPSEQLWWKWFLMTGEREQETIYTTWKDINLDRGTVSVRHKPQYGWSPKGYREREIPIPDTLRISLESVRPKKAGDGLLFHTESGLRKMDFLPCLKACVRRSGMDPAEWWLHRFRASFATWHLWSGTDLRTLQSWLGHTDLASTMRYLKPSRGQEVRDKVNATFA